jgi:Flp pilus assembly protein TadG
MHHPVKAARARLRRRVRGERGAVALLMALCLTVLLVASAMVLDFGLVKVDRQVNKSAADSATSAGLYGLMSNDGTPHPYAGICAAISYLQKNADRFSAANAGSWTDGNGASQAASCTSASWMNRACTPGNLASWARYSWTGTYQGRPLRVDISSGYQLAGSAFSEETLPAVQADNADTAQGCDQLAVTITQNRKPGLGSLASAADLVSKLRTVGRVYAGPGGDAPAMLLLKRTGCPALSTGAAGGQSYIRVYGARSSNGRTQAGSIHSDSDGQGCPTLFEGKASDGIVAFAAPNSTNPTVADATKPGQITSVAGSAGMTNVTDLASNVYSSAALNETGAGSAARTAPAGRGLVTRQLVDNRYLAGVTSAVTGAQSGVFGSVTSANAVSNGYKLVTCSGAGVVSALPALTVTDKLFVSCSNTKSIPRIDAGTVVFSGTVTPSADISMPQAHHIYIFGSSSNAITLSTGGALRVHTDGNLTSASACSTAGTTSATNKAILFIKDGDIKQSGSGVLQMCNTTVIMMGGQANGCLPTVGYATAPAPMAKPCTPSTGLPVTGSGQLSMNGGLVDWTAPNHYDLMTLPNGEPDPALAPAWSDPNGPEDLAFWSESGVSSSATFNIGGNGALRTVGVFMVPNAQPFIIGGGGHQDLTNAQYIASSVELNGNTTSVSMRVDPNAAVTLPKLKLVGLVR